MLKNNPEMEKLFRQDFRAKEYFEELSGTMQAKINANAQKINSYEKLRKFTETLIMNQD